MTAASGERTINDKQTRLHLPVLRREKQTANHMRRLRCEKENNPDERDLEENEMNELKPCPFCGGKVEIVGIKNGNSFIVWCENCGLGFGIEKEYYLYQIIGAWNHRAEQGQSEKVAELKRELERVKQERDAAVKDMQEIMALTSEMRVCTKYCVNGHCYNRGGNMPCSPRWDASWSGHKMED